MAVFFNGQLLVTPTTASAVDDSAMRNQNLSVGNVVAMVGKSAGGKPKTGLRFGSPTEAKRVLRSGELLEAVLKAFAPSTETGGPQTVVAVRIDPATQAALVLSDAASKAVINLKSTGYGLGENQIKIRIEDGSVSGKRLTTQLGSAYYTADNVGRTAFTVKYTGAAATATIDVTATTVVLTAAPAPAVTIPLAQFSTVGVLVDRINSKLASRRPRKTAAIPKDAKRPGLPCCQRHQDGCGFCEGGPAGCSRLVERRWRRLH